LSKAQISRPSPGELNFGFEFMVGAPENRNYRGKA
jgi:hypothetical protein